LAATRTVIVYLLIGIKLSHDRVDIHMRTAAFFFQKMDLNKDGVVTLEEFLDSCMSDEDLSQSMAVFDSAF
jgi:surface polysaccharide O-acyltransferase-like enzyme